MSLVRLPAMVVLAAAWIGPVYAGSITTLYDWNNGDNGEMFDITNLTAGPVTILGSFSINVSDTSSVPIEVFYKSGTFQGFEATPGAWTLLGTGSATGQGANNPTPISVGAGFVIPSGGTDGLYITRTDFESLLETDNPNSPANATYSDGVIQLTLGADLQSYFHSNFNLGDTWDGTVNYSTSQSAVPEPAAWSLALLGLLGMWGWRRLR